jgi:hypothetical protein
MVPKLELPGIFYNNKKKVETIYASPEPSSSLFEITMIGTIMAAAMAAPPTIPRSRYMHQGLLGVVVVTAPPEAGAGGISMHTGRLPLMTPKLELPVILVF